MPTADDERESDFDHANLALNEGLKSCRAVVSNYRAMMSGDRGANSSAETSGQSHYISTTSEDSGEFDGFSSAN